MSLVRAAVRVPVEEAELAAARLIELVPSGLEESVDDLTTELVVYVDNADLDRIRESFPDVSATAVVDGWEDAWRGFHRAITIGRLWIGPPWETPPTGMPAVVIDPGRAFGTGAHPTTRLCVELLAGLPRGSLLDVGCGSGVLAVAAAKLGFAPVVAVDVDPVAVEVTRASAAANGVPVEVAVVDALTQPLPRADVAVANVLLPPVEGILTRLDVQEVITSGYLAGERPAHAGWDHVETRELDGWAAERFHRV